MPRISAALIPVLLLAACAPEGTRSDAGRAGTVVTSVGEAQIGGPFTLVDDTGATVTEAALLGQPSLIYFGFSYCPDVCPTALAKLGRAQELMGEAAREVQFILITVDPERDTPEQLAVYVTNNGFPEGLRGFTGTPEQVGAALEAYKVYARKASLDGSAAGYTMDHQDLVVMTGRDGKFVDIFTERATPQEIAGRVRAYLARG